MSGTVHVFDYLTAPANYPPQAFVVLFGEEPFLKRLAFEAVRGAVLGQNDTPYATFDGETVEWRELADELSTVALFGGKRLVFVTTADAFVTAHRERLERYVDKSRPTGVLLLDVATWQSNTRLYRAADQHGLQIECRAPHKPVGKKKVLDEGRIQKWLALRATSWHDAKLSSSAAATLLELVGPEFGILEQDLAKLALFAGPAGTITPEMVQEVVGGWHAKTVWDMLDDACAGNTAAALQQLDRLLQSGTNELAVFGSIAFTLRRFAAAARIYQQAERAGRRIQLAQALQLAGVPNWPAILEKTERQLKQLGRERAGRLYRWLLEADLALKGSHSAPQRARLVLELLLLRLSSQLTLDASRGSGTTSVSPRPKR
jgi:DNA polymerase-3 subunit delta